MKGGSDVAALYGMDKEQLDRGVPPHWNMYVAVANCDEATAKAASLGGSVILPAFDVMEHGRMSIIKDPTGAMLCLWEGRAMKGATVVDETNAFCWFEVYTNDTEAAKTFYTKLFGWGVGGDANYTEWKLGDKSIGGMMKIQAEWDNVPPHWMGYVMVEDCDATVAKVKANGGTIMVEPMDIPNMGRFALCDDPQKAGFAIFAPKKA
jgi:predicted enzyme related to lactoylglutathione lyase